MGILRIALIVLGVLLAALGGLWFLQGAGIVHLEPIACVAECEALDGPSLQWAIIGAVTFLAGAGLAGGLLLRGKRKG